MLAQGLPEPSSGFSKTKHTGCKIRQPIRLAKCSIVPRNSLLSYENESLHNKNKGKRIYNMYKKNCQWICMAQNRYGCLLCATSIQSKPFIEKGTTKQVLSQEKNSKVFLLEQKKKSKWDFCQKKFSFGGRDFLVSPTTKTFMKDQLCLFP